MIAGKINTMVRFRRNREMVTQTEREMRDAPGGGRAAPLTLEARMAGYAKQNGAPRLTARQRRQARRMEVRAALREYRAELANA